MPAHALARPSAAARTCATRVHFKPVPVHARLPCGSTRTSESRTKPRRRCEPKPRSNPFPRSPDEGVVNHSRQTLVPKQRGLNRGGREPQPNSRTRVGVVNHSRLAAGSRGCSCPYLVVSRQPASLGCCAGLLHLASAACTSPLGWARRRGRWAAPAACPRHLFM